MEHKGQINVASLSPDGKSVLTASNDTTARLWDAASGRPIGPPLKHQGIVEAATFSPDGKVIITGTWERVRVGEQDIQGGSLQRWRTSDGRPIGNPQKLSSGISAVVFRPDGKTVWTAGFSKFGRWDAATLRPIGRIQAARTGGDDESLTLSMDGRIAMVGGSGALRLYDAADGSVFDTKRLDLPGIHATLRSDGRMLFSPNRLFEVEIGRATLVHSQVDLDSKAFAPGGLYHVVAASFSTDGKMLLTGCDNQVAGLWDVKTGRLIGPLMRHQRAPLGGLSMVVAFSPDGRTVVTGSRDGSARLWDVSAVQSSGSDATVEGDAEQTMLWVQSITGERLDEAGKCRVINGDDLRQLRQRLKQLGGSLHQ
jgi:WD40 repeat protein